MSTFFLKNLIGAPILSVSGRNSGYLVDFVLTFKDGLPFCSKAVIFVFDASTNRSASIEDFSLISSEKLVLNKPVSDLKEWSDTNRVTATQLWDKSVIDTTNVRSVPINDLVLTLNDTNELYITAIDTSFSAALRRLNLDGFLSSLLGRIGFDMQARLIEWGKLIGFGRHFADLTSAKSAESLQNLHPADLADILDDLDETERMSVLDSLDEDVAADTLAEAEIETQQQIIENLDPETASEILEEMDPDEAADLLQKMDQEKAKAILSHMDIDDSSDLQKLLQHKEDTAGGIMTTEYATVFSDFTVQDAFAHLRLIAADIEIIYYMYVVDTDEKLLGVISIRDILSANPSQKVSELMDDDIVSVTPETKQEEVAALMNKYDYMAIPVINDRAQLIGVVTIDDVMDVMEEEASDDIFKLAGSSDEELNYTSPFQACKARLPWLLITLGTGFITSTILKNFINEFKEVLVLTFFVPVVMAMGGNTGIQSSTLVIRGMALNSFSGGDLFKRLLSEVASGAIMGLACGTVVGVWAQYLIATDAAAAANHTSIYLASTVGIAMMAAMTFAAMFGALVPIIFDRLEIDPAVASGPFVTSSNDIFALTIYYAVSFTMLAC